MYKVTLAINGKRLKAEGETLPDALGNLEKPAIIKTISTLTVEKEGKRTWRALNIPRTKSMFGNRIYRVILSKNLEHFLK